MLCNNHTDMDTVGQPYTSFELKDLGKWGTVHSV